MNIADALLEVDREAALSPNPSRKTGCVILDEHGEMIASGRNDYPGSVPHKDERLEGDARYRWLEHAERNAIHEAAFDGTPLRNSTFVLRWFPCVECARAIAGVGAARIVCTAPDWDEARYHFRDAEAILRESGVEIEYLEKAE